MEVKNLLEFIHSAKDLYTLDYAICDPKLINYLDSISVEEQFIQNIDLGIVYVYEKNLYQYTLVDGLNRIISLSLLLHAICECYKRTTDKNNKAINTIRKKYLLNGTKTKLRLHKKLQTIYEKIIYGERLSGKEKEHPMFVILHNYWTQIKENQLKAADIFRMLQKATITVVDVDNVNPRDLYYSINKDKKDLNQIYLIDDYLDNKATKDIWLEIKNLYQNKDADIIRFFKDFFWNDFNYKEFDKTKLYEYFKNYFDTMRKFQPDEIIISKIKKCAILYSDLLNINIQNPDIKKALIQIKMHNGEDTYAYLLNIYEDYVEGNFSESTFLEILATIREYLINREKTPNNVSFNELINYLNTFIACK